MLARGCGFTASARIWTRMLAMVRRFQKATAVAPKRADPAIRNAVDHRPRLGRGSAGGTVAISSRSCLSCFRESFIISSVLNLRLAGVLPSQYGTSTGSFGYLSLESIEKRRFPLGLSPSRASQLRPFLWNLVEAIEKIYEKYKYFVHQVRFCGILWM
jgi:hypothetical protein